MPCSGLPRAAYGRCLLRCFATMACSAVPAAAARRCISEGADVFCGPRPQNLGTSRALAAFWE
eukprot:5900435-Alexandrium_andersonii.AAC.1